MELKLRGAITIETEKGFKIHPKVIELMNAVEQTGSLNAAVKSIGMSYSYAWNLIHKTNCKLESPILISRRGGNGGGIAELTENGKLLLDYCKKIEADFDEFIGNHNIELS